MFQSQLSVLDNMSNCAGDLRLCRYTCFPLEHGKQISTINKGIDDTILLLEFMCYGACSRSIDHGGEATKHTVAVPCQSFTEYPKDIACEETCDLASVWQSRDDPTRPHCMSATSQDKPVNR